MVECTYSHIEFWMGLHLRVGLYGEGSVVTGKPMLTFNS